MIQYIRNSDEKQRWLFTSVVLNAAYLGWYKHIEGFRYDLNKFLYATMQTENIMNLKKEFKVTECLLK